MRGQNVCFYAELINIILTGYYQRIVLLSSSSPGEKIDWLTRKVTTIYFKLSPLSEWQPNLSNLSIVFNIECLFVFALN